MRSMEPYTCPSTENQIDELPAAACSRTEEIPESIIDVAGGTDDKLIIPPCCKSTSMDIENHHTTLDMLSHDDDDDDDDEILPCFSADVTSSSMEEEVLLGMFNVGLQKIVSTHDDQESARSKSWSIYKVEQNLKKVHEESTFHPKLISIGPFHHNKSEHLKLMEQHKWRFFSDFLKSMKLTAASTADADATTTDDDSIITADATTTDEEQHKWKFFWDFLISMKLTAASTADATTTADADDSIITADATTTTTDDDSIIMTRQKKHFLVSSMKKLEAETRACYSETFDDLGSNEFVQMMVLDGCFIIQLLLLFQKSGSSCRNADDPMYTWRSTLPHLRHDLLLLENQLPFLVLHELFAMLQIKKKVYKLTDLIFDFFNPVLHRENKVLDVCKKQLFFSNDYCCYNHLLDLFMSSFPERIPGAYFPDRIGAIQLCAYFPERIPPYRRDHAQGMMSIHCVTELREAGIELKKSDDHHDLLHIEFKEGELHIPTLFIDDNTVPVLLNFIAYEQRHHSIKPYFTSYLMFLDYLVNSSKDVEHLHYKGIINHGLGSDEEVATLFNKLCKEVVQDLGDDNYLSKVFAEVNQYFGKRRNRWRAAWKHEYFRTPWAFSSFLAAIVLIVLTLLQTYFSMYAYFRPPSN